MVGKGDGVRVMRMRERGRFREEKKLDILCRMVLL